MRVARWVAPVLALAVAAGAAAAQPEGKGADPPAARDDEALYHAAVAHEEAAEVSAALATYEELRRRHPRSALAPRALARLARLHARIGQYAEAAAALAEYARRYPADEEGHAALNDAVYYRKAMGDDARAIADTNAYIKLYGAKRPAEAARAFLALAPLVERKGKPALIAHLRAYLKTHGARGGADALVFAHARLGQLLWEASCPVKPIDGACAKRRRATRAPRCAPASPAAVDVVPRDARKVAEARAALDAAVKLYERAGGRFPDGDERQARHWYASALYHQAEADHEAMLSLVFPGGLDFDPARPAVTKASNERLERWFKDKDRAAGAAGRVYTRLITEVKDPHHAIAAAARHGQVALHFSDELDAVEVPAFLHRHPEAASAFCERMKEVAEPYRERALDSFGACLAASAQFGAWSDASRLCERELARLSPDQFPLARERWARPGTVAGVVAPEPAPAATWADDGPGAE